MEITEKQSAKITRLDALGMSLSKLAHEQVTLKEPIERRWLDDIRQFQGKNSADITSIDKEKEALGEKTGQFCEAFVNATRHKTNAGESIIGDLLFPNDQKNWGIEPTPVPEMMDDAKSTKPVMDEHGRQMQFGSPEEIEKQKVNGEDPKLVTEGHVANAAIEMAKDKAIKMERQIEDQFDECDYNGESRKVIHYSAMIGTGVLKGPVVEHRHEKRWGADDEGKWCSTSCSNKTASVKSLNPFQVYPDMTAATPEEMEFIFEASYPNKRQMRDLAKDPKVNKENLRKVLEQKPGKHITYTQYNETLRAISGLNSISQDNRYEFFAYYGPIDSHVLREVGVITSAEEEDVLKEFYGVVWFSGNTVLKVVLNPDGFEPFPFYFYTWETDHASCFGFGVPYLMRQSQRVINVAWRQMLDNSSNTAGPQIVIDKGLIEPENGDWTIEPFKVWTKKRTSQTSVKDAFSVFSFNNHQQEIAGIYNMAQEIADQESGIPKLQEGQQGKVQTLGEASMQQSNANNDTRRRVRDWDDNITKKLLGQFYDWNMKFTDDNSIKGDYRIKATGSSTLLAREQTQNALIQVARDIMPNEQFAPYMNTGKILKKLIQSFHLTDEGLIRTEDEVKSIQEQNSKTQQPDPMALKAQADMALLEVKKQEIEFGYKKLETMETIEYIKLAQAKELTLEQLDSKLEAVKIQQRVSLDKFNRELELALVKGEGI